MERAEVTIVVTTRDRPQMLGRAVESALAQTHPSVEVVVVDDGSTDAVEDFDDERVTVLRHPSPRGVGAARNTGLEAAHGRWIAYLDDDDWLLPHMVQVSLEGLAQTTLPPPVAALSALKVLDASGRVLATKRPPTCPRGTVFGLEAVPGFPLGTAYETKQTLVIEREVLRAAGGWAEDLRSRVTTELFLRLSDHCSLLGLPVTTYMHLHHQGPRVGSAHDLGEESFDRLVRKHRAAFEAHPAGYANLLRLHARELRRTGRWRKSLVPLAEALRRDPLKTIASTPGSASRDVVARILARRPRGAGRAG